MLEKLLEPDWASAHARLTDPQVLRDFVSQMAGLPRQRGPLAVRTMGEVMGEGFTISKLTYEAEPCSTVPAHLYVPIPGGPPAPAIVVACGHGGSKSVFYNQYAGQLLAKAGLVVLAPDPLGEEERDAEGRIGTRAHDAIAQLAQAAGRPVVGKMVYDLMRGIDLLVERPEVDSSRIGVVGHSLGAVVGAYLAALDARVKTAVLAATYFAPSTREKLCTRGLYELIKLRVDYATLLALGAPGCATLLCVGDDDAICGGQESYVRWFDPLFARAWSLYDAQGAPCKLARRVYPNAGHRPFFLGREAVLWLQGTVGLPRMSRSQVRAAHTIRLGDWAAWNGVEIEEPYNTEAHYAGTEVLEAGVRYLSPSELRCVSDDQRRSPQFTLEGWLRCIGARHDPPPRTSRRRRAG